MSAIIPTPEPQLGKLCAPCRNIFDDWEEIQRLFEKKSDTYNIPYHKDPFAWQAAVNKGCVLCMRLFDSLTKDETRKLSKSLQDGVEVEVSLSISDNCYLLADEEMEYTLLITFFQADGNGMNLCGCISLSARLPGMHMTAITHL
jgi:hypothetical protein